VHGDMTQKTQPDAGTTRYKYDHRHNVRFSQNAQQASGGKVSYFTYDRFNRMIRSGEVTRAFASLDPNTVYAFETDAASWTSRYTYDASESGSSRGSGSPATCPWAVPRGSSRTPTQTPRPRSQRASPTTTSPARTGTSTSPSAF